MPKLPTPTDFRGGDNFRKGGPPVTQVVRTKRRKIKNRPKQKPSDKGFGNG